MSAREAVQGLLGEGAVGDFSLNHDGSLNVRAKFLYGKLPSDLHFRVLELLPRKCKLPFDVKFVVPSYPYLLGKL